MGKIVLWILAALLEMCLLYILFLTGKWRQYRPGHRISVKFDRPTPIRIDGETIPGVTGYGVTGARQPVGV